MTLVVIGPVTEDLIVIGSQKSQKIGGATYFQSFVFEEFYSDYLAVINTSNKNAVNEFPDNSKVKLILKDDTHYFINNYHDENDLDIRVQMSNFCQIPIEINDLENILPEDIDAFVMNPLNRYDFPPETVEYLKSFDVPIFLSLQGFLRKKDVRVNENWTIKLSNFDGLSTILDGVSAIFLDEVESNIIGELDNLSEIIITDGSNGSRIKTSDGEVDIKAVECKNIVDTTGCGDTYMAAYISQRLNGKSVKKSGDFASKIASEKIANFGPFKK